MAVLIVGLLVDGSPVFGYDRVGEDVLLCYRTLLVTGIVVGLEASVRLGPGLRVSNGQGIDMVSIGMRIGQAQSRLLRSR